MAVELFDLRGENGRGAAAGAPAVPARWSRSDAWGRIRCRLFNSFRMNYTVEPGIYAVGAPDGRSPVLVTANYKLGFDLLRRELGGFDAWIVVLDTRGINVWCAAAKGPCSTQEVVQRVQQIDLPVH